MVSIGAVFETFRVAGNGSWKLRIGRLSVSQNSLCMVTSSVPDDWWKSRWWLLDNI